MRKLLLLFYIILFSDVALGQPEVDSLYILDVNATFYSIYSADFRQAIQSTERAVELSIRNRWPSFEATSQKNLGVVCYMSGEYEKANSAYLRAYHLFDSLGDKSGLARVCNEMGNFSQKQGDRQKALALWKQAERLATESGDLEALGTAYGMQATFHWMQGRYDLSDPLYWKNLAIRLLQNDSVGLGYSYVSIGEMKFREGKMDSAIYYFDQSNTIRERIGDFQGIAENHLDLANLMKQIPNLNKAKEFYLKALEESITLGYHDLRRKCYDSLASIYKVEKKFSTALRYKLLAEDLEDSLFNIERSKTIADLQTRYETERKEQQIKLQHSQIEQQQAELRSGRVITAALIVFMIFLFSTSLLLYKRQQLKQEKLLAQEKALRREAQLEAAISSQESERKRFARDLHDGFGQMISVLNINLKSLEKNNPDRHSIFENSTRVLQEMYRELKSICFNLMPETLIKNGVVDALNEFAQRINLANKVAMRVDSFGIQDRLTDIQEINLYRICQEWINNIIKYSDATMINVQLTRDETEITLMIEDNGTGFDSKLVTESQGNGWKNIQSRSNLLGGVVELETTHGVKGNALILNIPVAKQIPIQVSHAKT